MLNRLFGLIALFVLTGTIFLGCDDDNKVDLCGDGKVDPGEECDSGELQGRRCADFGYKGGFLNCNTQCQYDFSQCIPITCGDSVIDTGEECDGSELGGKSCTDFGYDGGELGCMDTCKFDFSQCQGGECGNGIREFGEECDGTDLGMESCATLGYASGQLSCTSDCKLDTSGCETGAPVCGNGVKEPGEECDGMDLGDATSCVSLGYYGGELGCTKDCLYDETECQAFGRCGDGIIQDGAGEQCDLLNWGGVTSCADLGLGEGRPTCGPDCRFDTSTCSAGACGNGTVDPGEVCDGEVDTPTLNVKCRESCTHATVTITPFTTDSTAAVLAIVGDASALYAGVAIDDGNSLSSSVNAYNFIGELQWSWPVPGTSHVPLFLAQDQSHIFVVRINVDESSTGVSVYVLDKENGTSITHYDIVPSEAGRYIEPTAFAVDPNSMTAYILGKTNGTLSETGVTVNDYQEGFFLIALEFTGSSLTPVHGFGEVDVTDDIVGMEVLSDGTLILYDKAYDDQTGSMSVKYVLWNMSDFSPGDDQTLLTDISGNYDFSDVTVDGATVYGVGASETGGPYYFRHYPLSHTVEHWDISNIDSQLKDYFYPRGACFSHGSLILVGPLSGNVPSLGLSTNPDGEDLAVLFVDVASQQAAALNIGTQHMDRLTIPEADVSGPWITCPTPESFAVIRNPEGAPPSIFMEIKAPPQQ